MLGILRVGVHEPNRLLQASAFGFLRRKVSNTEAPVGASLLAIAVCQLMLIFLINRYREQARSYRRRAMGLCRLLELLPILVRRQFRVLAEQPRKEAGIVVADFIADGLDALA